MKKILFALLLCCLLVSCNKSRVIPIELHKGNVVTLKFNESSYYPDLQVKCKDSVYWICVTQYDAERFNIGDTIK